MKTCTACNQVRPEESFYREGSWCQDCRVIKRAEWKAKNPANAKAHKMISEQTQVDPTAYGKLHCEHIAGYAKRAIERFERKTGNEAPPELTAIYQLASRLTDQQHAQLISRAVVVRGSRITRRPQPRECLQCGATYKPKGQYISRFCSDPCRTRFKELIRPPRYQGKLTLMERAARQAKQATARAAKATAQEQIEYERNQRIERARQALEMRKAGAKWKDITTAVGFNNPGSAYAAIRHLLGVDPHTIGVDNRRSNSGRPSTPRATT